MTHNRRRPVRSARRRCTSGALLTLLLLGLIAVPAVPSMAGPVANLHVSLTFGDVGGCGFAADSSVTVTIKETPASATPLFSGPTPTDSVGCIFLQGDETQVYPLSPGNFVSATDGATTTDIVLEPVAIGVVSTIFDTVSGTAAPTEHVLVRVSEGEDEWTLETDADGTGNWTVDFTTTKDVLGFSLISALVFDGDGDATAAFRSAPHVEGHLNSDGVSGCGFAAGSVTVRIRNAPGGTLLFAGTATTSEPDGCFFVEEGTHGQDLVPGMNLRATQEGIVAADLTLAQLSVDSVDAATDIVSGTAPPGADVYVLFEGEDPGEVVAAADGAGDWSVDLTGTFDVRSQDFITAEVEDEDGDVTQATWVAPFLLGNLTTDEVGGCGWHDPATLTIRSAPGGTVLFTGPVSTAFGGCFTAPETLHGEDLVPGRSVELTDGSVSRSVTLVTLTVDAADAAAGTSSGTAPPLATVFAGFQLPERGDGSEVTADETGHWSWSFGEPVAGEPGEPPPVFFAEVEDGDGDITHADHVSSPCTKVGATLMLDPGIFTIANSGGNFNVTGAGVTDPTCGGATMTNINTVQAAGGTGNQTLTINLAGGPIGPGLSPEGTGTSEIEIQVGFAPGDSLIVNGASGNDALSFGSPGVGLNGDSDADVTNPAAPSSLGSVQLHGAGGPGDRITVFENANLTLTNSLLTVGSLSAGLSTIELATLTGGIGNNTINASGFTGPTTLTGLGGLDTLIGGANADTLNGGVGDDVLTGNGGSNTLLGEDGLDRVAETGNVNMTLSNTNLTFGVGADSLSSIERATLTGGNGINVLNAQAFSLGPVTLSGLAGPDTLTGGSGNDTLLGGLDNDVLSGRAGSNTVNGEGGVDQVVYNWTSGAVNLHLGSGSASGPGFGDVLSNIERALGSNFNDSLVGNGLPNILEGAGGNDVIDTRDGIRGNDSANGGGGTDTCRTDLNDGRASCEA